MCPRYKVCREWSRRHLPWPRGWKLTVDGTALLPVRSASIQNVNWDLCLILENMYICVILYILYLYVCVSLIIYFIPCVFSCPKSSSYYVFSSWDSLPSEWFWIAASSMRRPIAERMLKPIATNYLEISTWAEHIVSGCGFLFISAEWTCAVHIHCSHRKWIPGWKWKLNSLGWSYLRGQTICMVVIAYWAPSTYKCEVLCFYVSPRTVARDYERWEVYLAIIVLAYATFAAAACLRVHEESWLCLQRLHVDHQRVSSCRAEGQDTAWADHWFFAFGNKFGIEVLLLLRLYEMGDPSWREGLRLAKCFKGMVLAKIKVTLRGPYRNESMSGYVRLVFLVIKEHVG